VVLDHPKLKLRKRRLTKPIEIIIQIKIVLIINQNPNNEEIIVSEKGMRVDLQSSGIQEPTHIEVCGQ